MIYDIYMIYIYKISVDGIRHNLMVIHLSVTYHLSISSIHTI